jgi:subtilase family serine protease
LRELLAFTSFLFWNFLIVEGEIRIMRRKHLPAILIGSFLALIGLVTTNVSGQGGAPSRISAAIDNTKLTTLRGNVHPLARAEYDRGAAPASLPMEHMLLVLTRSPAQQAALETLLAGQQDRSSPNYHQWLTPEQFGQQFGPSDQDMQRITAWLQSQGFQVNEVSKGRGTIDFSGNAGQVQQAFHTAIHSYVFANGEQHWANASEPQIPTALAPVVDGVNSLNNFRRKSMSHSLGQFRRSKADGKITAVHPTFTYPSSNCGNSSGNCYALGPADFGKIYNVPTNVTGTGQIIAIVSDSDINASDVTAFRSLFGLPTINFQQIETGTDPGVQAAGDEIEAVLDVEWAGALAPGAQIDLIVSPTTNTAFGGDTSAQYIVNNNLAPILSYSYGECELDLGTSVNAFYQQLWSQAASQGITVLVSTGDNGSAGCENPDPTNLTTAQPATTGLAVNGVGSTPFNVAVGGTDFNDLSNPATYWGSTNSTTQASALSYIPETAYNDSCTNTILFNVAAGFSSTPETNCNNASLVGSFGTNFIASFGGGGGASNCTTSSTTSTTIGPVSSCSGGYAKPSWQFGPGVPNDGKRDIPDVSLFSGDGTVQNFYIACEADQDSGNAPCSLSSPFQDFLGVGGTSVAAQAFAGIVALIDQKTGSRQGNLNPTLYALAAEQSASSCNSSSSPASTCTFYDVTFGTIAMPCAKNSPNCTVTNSSDTVGVLSGFSATTGFDLATGLGSVNVGNLVNNFGPNFYLSSSSPVVTVSSPGASGTMSVTAVAVDGYTGTVNLSCSGLPTGAACSFSPASVAFTANATSVPVTVTVSTTSASWLAPFGLPGSAGRWKEGGGIALVLGLILAVLFANKLDKERRPVWASSALALAAFAIVIGLAACGGGSSASSSGSGSGSTTGPTGNTTATLTGTASSGAPVSSMTFTLTIQ